MIVEVDSIRYRIKNKEDHIEKVLLHGNKWNARCINLIKYYANKFKLNSFLNIGCHIGTVCIPLSPFFDKITAIEAYEPTYNHLLENIELNDIDNIETLNLAISDKKEVIYFMDENRSRIKNNSGGMHVITREDIQDQKRSYHIMNKNAEVRGKADKLDNLNIDYDIVLIDIEGMEEKMLRGAKKSLLKNWPVIIIEIWDDIKRKEENMGTSRKDIIKYIVELGYKLDNYINDDFVFLPKRY